MKLADIIRSVQADLPISVRHEQWLARNPEQNYSEEAVAFAQRALAGEYSNRKRMMFRSSSTGMCARRRVYSAIKIPESQTPDSKLSNIFHTGNFLHLKWQMAGLTEGWLTDAEVAYDNPDINFGGTLDGVIYDGSGFEFKSINDRGFNSVMSEPKALHILQVHAYMYLNPQFEKFSIVYENKNTGEWREYRVDKDPTIVKQIDREVGALNDAVEQRKLPPVLSDCAAKQGTQYRQCPFNDICLGMKKWPNVVGGKVI